MAYFAITRVGMVWSPENILDQSPGFPPEGFISGMERHVLEGGVLHLHFGNQRSSAAVLWGNKNTASA